MNLIQAKPKVVITWIRHLISKFIIGEERIIYRRSWIMSATLRETNSWTRVGMRKIIRQSQINFIVLNSK